MIDKDGRERREEVFKEIRSLNNEIAFAVKELEELKSNLSKKQNELADRRNKSNQLERMVRTMIIHDCCPVEAKLKYRDEFIFNNGNTDASTDMRNTGGGQTLLKGF